MLVFFTTSKNLSSTWIVQFYLVVESLNLLYWFYKMHLALGFQDSDTGKLLLELRRRKALSNALQFLFKSEYETSSRFMKASNEVLREAVKSLYKTIPTLKGLFSQKWKFICQIQKVIYSHSYCMLFQTQTHRVICFSQKIYLHLSFRICF